MIDTCPRCLADLRGEPIPEADRASFGGEDRVSRKVGIYDQCADMTVGWRCPDCGHEWPAIPGTLRGVQDTGPWRPGAVGRVE